VPDMLTSALVSCTASVFRHSNERGYSRASSRWLPLLDTTKRHGDGSRIALHALPSLSSGRVNPLDGASPGRTLRQA
jgi:hypothetical protein